MSAEQKAIAIADKIVPAYRDGGRRYSCTGNVAKMWQAAYDGALAVLTPEPTPARPVPVDAAREYFERGFLASYAWHVTNREGEALSDAVLDHAWDNREEGGPLPTLATEAQPSDVAEPRWSWWVGSGENPETYDLNERTRDAAIAAGCREYQGDVFTIVYATQDGPFNTTPFDDASLIDQLIERFAEDNGDRFGEDGFEGDFDNEALAEAMNAAFDAFIIEHGSGIRTWSFTGQIDREIIRPDVVGEDG